MCTPKLRCCKENENAQARNKLSGAKRKAAKTCRAVDLQRRWSGPLQRVGFPRTCPEHSRQKSVPKVIDAHCGFGVRQSTHACDMTVEIKTNAGETARQHGSPSGGK
jgi:hypothetical protein